MASGMPNRDLVSSGNAFTPEPWDLAHELWYWHDHEDKIDIPLPKDCTLLNKHDRLNYSCQH